MPSASLINIDNLEGCVMNGKCKECKYSNNHDVCKKCSNNYEDKFSPKVIPEGYSQCISCKRVLPIGEGIFPYVRNRKKGLCFNCY